jgi:hypothetical protein
MYTASMFKLIFSKFSNTEVKSELLGLGTPSIVRNSNKLENMTFRELDLFPSSYEEREAPTLLGPLERDNLNHWTSLLDIGTMDKVLKPTDFVCYTPSSSWVFAACCLCEIKLRGVFRLRNVTIVGFYYLLFT